MENSKKEILDYIKKNRVSSTEIADALYKTGAIVGVSAINKGHFRTGNVFWTYASNQTNWNVHEAIQNVQEGDLVIVDVIDCNDRAIFGELVSKYLMLYKQASGIVVNGFVRDAPRLLKENWPIWCKGFTPIGCENTNNTSLTFEQTIYLEKSKSLYEGAIAVCDDCGVVVIPKEYHTKEFYERLQFIEEQEDIWFECIDRKKLSTYETVCLKKYLVKE